MTFHLVRRGLGRIPHSNPYCGDGSSQHPPLSYTGHIRHHMKVVNLFEDGQRENTVEFFFEGYIIENSIILAYYSYVF
jgi:hypothetical protein